MGLGTYARRRSCHNPGSSVLECVRFSFSLAARICRLSSRILGLGTLANVGTQIACAGKKVGALWSAGRRSTIAITDRSYCDASVKLLLLVTIIAPLALQTLQQFRGSHSSMSLPGSGAPAGRPATRDWPCEIGRAASTHRSLWQCAAHANTSCDCALCLVTFSVCVGGISFSFCGCEQEVMHACPLVFHQIARRGASA